MITRNISKFNKLNNIVLPSDFIQLDITHKLRKMIAYPILIDNSYKYLHMIPIAINIQKTKLFVFVENDNDMHVQSHYRIIDIDIINKYYALHNKKLIQ